MKVQFTNLLQNYGINNVKNNTQKKNDSASLPILQNDVFVKSTNNVSFKGSYGIPEKVDVKDTIIGIGAAGTAFLMPLILTVAMAKHQNPDEIFTQDGLYLGKANEIFVDKTKAAELGFELDPERFNRPYCLCDKLSGVFRDYKKGIDINLPKGKYVDLTKGIYINPDDQTSVIFTKGEAVPVILPSFTGSPYSHSNSVHIDYPVGSREEFIKEHGEVPEPSDTPWVMDELNSTGLDPIGEEALATIYKARGFEPIDRRSILEQTKNFLFGNEEPTYLHDYWGRDVVQVFDKVGNSHYVALTDDLSEKIHNEHISYETAQALLTHAAEHPIENYIRENYSSYSSNIHLLDPSMEDFLEHIKHDDSDYIHQYHDLYNETNDENAYHNNDNYLHNNDVDADDSQQYNDDFYQDNDDIFDLI